jgi:hypothetical protein
VRIAEHKKPRKIFRPQKEKLLKENVGNFEASRISFWRLNQGQTEGKNVR